MILEKDFEDFIVLLNKYQVEYMVIGGYALMFHGKPRYTGDLDIWIAISDQNAQKTLSVIKDFGMASLGLTKDDFLKPGIINQIGYPPLRIDILNEIDGIEFAQAKTNVQLVTMDNGVTINYIGVQDFIKNKKATGREQDIADIKEIQKKEKSLLPKKKTKSSKNNGRKS
jgi:predicted nucleotidyltransferase